MCERERERQFFRATAAFHSCCFWSSYIFRLATCVCWVSESGRVSQFQRSIGDGWENEIMIDWLTILLALAIIAVLVGIFAFMAWKINVPDPLTADSTGKKDENNQSTDNSSAKRRKDKHGNDQSSKKRKDPRKAKRENKGEEKERHNSVTFKEPPTPTSEETDDEREESEQVWNHRSTS